MPEQSKPRKVRGSNQKKIMLKVPVFESNSSWIKAFGNTSYKKGPASHESSSWKLRKMEQRKNISFS